MSITEHERSTAAPERRRRRVIVVPEAGAWRASALRTPVPLTQELDEAAARAQGWQLRYRRRLVFVDLVAVTAMLSVAVVGLAMTHRLATVDLQIGIALFPAWLLAIAMSRAYEMRFLDAGTEEFKRISAATLWLTAVVGTGSFLVGAPVSRYFVAMALPATGMVVLGERFAARSLLHRHRRRHDACLHRVIAVGSAEDVRQLTEQVLAEPSAGWRIIGACLTTPHAGPVEAGGLSIPNVGSPEHSAQAAASHGADTIAVLRPGAMGRDGIRRLAWQLEGSSVHLFLSPSLTDVAGPRVTIRPLVGLPLLHLEQPAFSGFQRAIKATIDRVLALLLVLLLSPVLLVIAAAVGLSTHGPVIFRQQRVGVGGRTFTCLKFRSMFADAEQRRNAIIDLNETDGLMFKIKADPRITKIGGFLRRTSLDELPQMLNVLRGQMSLVGPRPPVPSEVARYETDVHRRLLVKPGMTGLWQVSGRADLTWEESVRLDLYYVENWSPLLDLSILVKTGVAVLRGAGAY